MASIEELKEKKQELENDPDVKGNARIARLEAQIENKKESGDNSSESFGQVETDTDLDGEKESSPGVAVAGTKEDFESGEVENAKTEVLAEQRQTQLEEKKEAIKSSDSEVFQTSNGETITKDQAVENVEESIQLAERIEKQSQENLETIEERQNTRDRSKESGNKGFNLVDPDGSQTDFKPEQALNQDSSGQQNFVQSISSDLQTGGRNLVQTAGQVGDKASSALQSNPITSNLGEKFAGGLETTFTFANALEDVSTPRSGDTLQSLKKEGKDFVETTVASSTPLDELNLIEEPESLQDRTKQVQSAAVGTPLDTAGFAAATGGGVLSISEEQGARFVTRSARELTGDEDLGRNPVQGEGLERLGEGTAIIASEVSKNPESQVTEEVTQEATEAVLGAGLITPTVTATPSVTNTVEGTVKTGASKARSAVDDFSLTQTRKGQVGVSSPGNTRTQGPGTRDTVTIDQDALTGNPDSLVLPDTTTETTSTAETGLQSLSTGSTTAENTSETIFDSRPQSQTVSEGLGQTFTDSPSLSETPSLTGTPSITSTATTTQTPSQTVTDTVTSTPSETITDTPSLTTTTTPDIGPGDDEDEDNLLLQEEGKGKDRVFSSSVGAELAGVTAEEQPEFFSSPTQLRPVIENEEDNRESIL